MENSTLNNNKKVIVIEDGTTYNVDNKKDCVKAVIEEYIKYDVSMSEVLASVEIQGFSVEDVVDIYAECMKISDGDVTVRFTDDIPMEIIEDALILGIGDL